jgi:hypothetical protein
MRKQHVGNRADRESRPGGNAGLFARPKARKKYAMTSTLETAIALMATGLLTAASAGLFLFAESIMDSAGGARPRPPPHQAMPSGKSRCLRGLRIAGHDRRRLHGVVMTKNRPGVVLAGGCASRRILALTRPEPADH